MLTPRPARVTVTLVSTLTCAALLSGCSGDDGGQKASTAGPWDRGAVLPAEDQVAGDPVVGKELLLNGNYMSCGIPRKLWDDPGLGT